MSTPFVLPFIRWANVSRISPDKLTSTRRLYDHELVYVLAGQGHIVLERATFEFKPDRLFLLQPRVWHSFHANDGELLDLMGVHFDWAPQHDTLAFPIFFPATEPMEESKFRQPRNIDGWNLQEQPFLDLKGSPRTRQALEAVINEFARDDEQSREAAGALLAAAILHIEREVRLQSERDQSTLIGADAVRRVHRARELLQANLQAPLSVEEVAAQIGWSGDHLRRMTRQVLNTSPAKLQIDARLHYARDLLRHESISIAEVGRRCGFEDSSHFARVFKAQSGLTPRQYLQLAKRL